MKFFFKTFLIYFLLLLFGCASTSKRFYTGTKKRKETIKKNSRFAPPNKEEIQNDDKKVDIEKIKTTDFSKKNIQKNNLKDELTDNIISLLGTPYVYGGEDKNGMDCSAFVKRIYSDVFQVSLPRTTKEQMQLGIEIQLENIKLGDLIFFNTSNEVPSHVGIYIEDNLFAHASVSFGVTISSLESSYYKKTYITTKRILNQ